MSSSLGSFSRSNDPGQVKMCLVVPVKVNLAPRKTQAVSTSSSTSTPDSLPAATHAVTPAFVPSSSSVLSFTPDSTVAPNLVPNPSPPSYRAPTMYQFFCFYFCSYS